MISPLELLRQRKEARKDSLANRKLMHGNNSSKLKACIEENTFCSGYEQKSLIPRWKVSTSSRMRYQDKNKIELLDGDDTYEMEFKR